MRINSTIGGTNIQLNTARHDNNFKNAKKTLNMMIVADSTPFVPFQQGQLRSQVRYPQGIFGDEIEWYAPYAHYQYVGELYLTESGQAWAEAGEKKQPADKPLQYHENGTSAEWFEKAKKENMQKWLNTVKRIEGR